jgi:hypothetical protein
MYVSEALASSIDGSNWWIAHVAGMKAGKTVEKSPLNRKAHKPTRKEIAAAEEIEYAYVANTFLLAERQNATLDFNSDGLLFVSSFSEPAVKPAVKHAPKRKCECKVCVPDTTPAKRERKVRTPVSTEGKTRKSRKAAPVAATPVVEVEAVVAPVEPEVAVEVELEVVVEVEEEVVVEAIILTSDDAGAEDVDDADVTVLAEATTSRWTSSRGSCRCSRKDVLYASPRRQAAGRRTHSSFAAGRASSYRAPAYHRG